MRIRNRTILILITCVAFTASAIGCGAEASETSTSTDPATPSAEETQAAAESETPPPAPRTLKERMIGTWQADMSQVSMGEAMERHRDRFIRAMGEVVMTISETELSTTAGGRTTSGSWDELELREDKYVSTRGAPAAYSLRDDNTLIAVIDEGERAITMVFNRAP